MDYIPFDEHTKKSNGLSIKFSDIAGFDYLGTLRIVVTTPDIKVTAGVPSTVAWTWEVIVRAIDVITITSATITAGPVQYIITGEQIAESLHWNRDFILRPDEVVGNIPQLLTFSSHLPSYENVIKLPLFWDCTKPFPLNLCNDEATTITITMKKTRDLLRVRYGNGVDMSYGDPTFTDQVYQGMGIKDESFSGEVEYRPSNCSDFVNHPDGQLYKHRLVPTYIESISSAATINRRITLPITVGKHVLGFMWHLQPIFLDARGREMDIHAYGNYSLNPLTGSTHDPVCMTTLTITRMNGTTEPPIHIRGCRSRQPDTKHLNESFSVGRHIHTFGTHPWRGLKNPGKDIASVEFVCTSSDQFVAASSLKASNIDISRILAGFSPSQPDKPVDINLDEQESLLRTSSMLQRQQQDQNEIPEVRSIAYKLVVFTIVSNQMNITNGKISFDNIPYKEVKRNK